MSGRQKYNFERLQKYCSENNVTLLDDYSNVKLTKDAIIKGNCVYENCNNSFEKKFNNVIKTGGYCKDCIKIILVEKTKKVFLQKYGSENILQLDFIASKTNKNKFNFEKLQNYCKENNLVLLNDYSNINLTKKSIIKTKCQSLNCIIPVEKSFRETEKRGAYCKECMNNLKQEKTKNTCLQKYGTKCVSQYSEYKNKCKQTSLEKYGVEYPFQSNDVKNKIKETNLSKYGFNNPMKNEKIKNKTKLTNIKKYGCETTLYSNVIKEKVKKTIIEKYGVENASQSIIIKNKKKETCLNNWGVEYPSQNKEIMNKIINSSYCKKEFIFPSGKIELVQGYEPFALNDLIINDKINESDIIVGVLNVPEIWFTDENNEKHRYYVDIYIPSQNKCIEVKSLYTYNDNIATNLLKQDAAIKMGYKFEFWIYNHKGQRISINK